MLTFAILEHLQLHGQQSDIEIARAVNAPLHDVTPMLEKLAHKGEVARSTYMCVIDGKRIDGFAYRLVGRVHERFDRQPQPTIKKRAVAR